MAIGYSLLDPDKVEIIAIRLISYTTEDRVEIYCKHSPDVQHIITNRITLAAEKLFRKNIEYHLQ